ncbi:kinesin-like protein KIN-14K [Jatropha curcas]|uniref:kinesin-like protein KIN-14K n=1 Tax=Jatropha curcas TaxID=180498 RepID=UPI0018938E58|nr:kinesin-like protein KIN-14K [Jatropha curcas]
MNSMSDQFVKQCGRINSGRFSSSSDVFEPTITLNEDIEAKQQIILIEWINSILPNLDLPLKASSEQFRAFLIDGIVLLQIINKLIPGSANEGGGSDHLENVKKFLAIMDELGIPRFEISDLEKGPLKARHQLH